MYRDVLIELRLDIARDGWGQLSVGSQSGHARVPISCVVDVVGQLVGAAVGVLTASPEARLEWDSELDTAVITLTKQPDERVRFDIAWRSHQAESSTFAFELRTEQPGRLLAERVLDLADHLDPVTYATDWRSEWPVDAIRELRKWLASAEP